MNAFEELRRANASLQTSITNFPIGAITLNDFKPTDEKIRDMRESLKCLRARIQLLQATNGINSMPEVLPENLSELEEKLQNTISQRIHMYKTLKNAAQSLAVESIFKKEINSELRNKFQAVMNKLYIQNDKIIALQEKIEEMYLKERRLQMDVASCVIEFQDFLKEQEEIRNRKLAESNPEIASKKERLKKMILKVNITKRIITNFMSASNANFIENPELLEMLKRHRDLVNAESIREMV